jgi:hypothetical protein
MMSAGRKLSLLLVVVAGSAALVWILATGPGDGTAGDASMAVAGTTPVTGADPEPEPDPQPVAPPVPMADRLSVGDVVLDPPDSGDDELEDGPLEPRREGDVYAELMALAGKSGSQALVIEVQRILGGNGPGAEKVAALRAARDVESPAATGLFLSALTLPAEPDGRHGVSVPTWALRDLGQRADRDPGARAALRSVALEEVQVADPRLRRRAASRLAEVGSIDDLLALSSYLRPDDDALLLRGVAVGLQRNPLGPEVAQHYAGLLPSVPTGGETDGEPP